MPGSVAPNAPHATRAAPPVAAHSWMATVSDARSGGSAESASSAQWTQTYAHGGSSGSAAGFSAPLPRRTRVFAFATRLARLEADLAGGVGSG